MGTWGFVILVYLLFYSALFFIKVLFYIFIYLKILICYLLVYIYILLLCSIFFNLGFNSMWTENFQMYKVDLEKREEPEIKLPTSSGS